MNKKQIWNNAMFFLLGLSAITPSYIIGISTFLSAIIIWFYLRKERGRE